MYVCVCVYIYIYMHMHVYVCVCVCVCVGVCVCVVWSYPILQSTLRQIHNIFRIEFSTECDLVLSFVHLQYPLFSFRPSSSCLPLLPCLPFTPSSYFPSITCFRKQSLCKMWPNEWGSNSPPDCFFSWGRIPHLSPFLEIDYPAKLIMWYNYNVCKSSPVRGLEWPRGYQEVKVPRFRDNSTGWW